MTLKNLRIGVLLLILFMVGSSAYLTRARLHGWENELWVAVHPINGDGSEASAAHIRALTQNDFAGIEAFFEAEAEAYGLALAQPIQVVLGQVAAQGPPALPADRRPWTVILWSLRLQYWIWRFDAAARVPADIRLFVRYHDPARHPRLPHSYGIDKARVGVVNAFASRAEMGRNQVVMVHELLHTLGASDKYDLETNLPRFPDGYAEPGLAARYPQRFAEIMGGRVPVAPDQARIPANLEHVLIGPKTAEEIGWPAR